jgi:drug/metabolite transporter (DMT)-like permease
LSLIFEGPLDFSLVTPCILPLLYLGIGSSGVAYTLQILGQKRTHPAIASAVLSLESVFGAIAGAIVLHEAMSLREYVGCAVVFAAVILSQLDLKAIFGKKKEQSVENS